MGNAQERESRHRFGERAVYIAIYGTLLLILAAADPFGLKSAADAESRDLFFNIAAPFYRLGEPTEAAVVLIEERSLKAAGETNPPTFMFYDSILGTLMDLGARAVFLDILFVDDRPDTAAFAAALRQYQDAGMPVVLASGLKSGEPCTAAQGRERQRPEVADAAAYLAAVYYERSPGTYPPTVALGCAPERRRSAALEMLRQSCADSDATCRQEVAVIEQRPADQPMIVQWGNAPPEIVRDLYHAEGRTCRRRPAGIVEAMAQSLEKLGLSLGSGFADDTPLLDQCPYVPWIFAEELVPGATTVAPARSDLLRRAVAGKVVFVGMRLDGTNDVTVSPVHGVLPGVFLHAMAFDNLVGMGAAYFRPWPAVAFGIGLDDLVEIALLLLVVAAEDRVRRVLAGPRKTSPTVLCSLLILTGFVIGAALLLFVVALVMTFAWRVDPVNWLGIVGISLLLVQEAFQNLVRRVAASLFPSPVKGE